MLRKVGNHHLRSGELAKLTGVSTDTLRHYERVGVLARPGRTEAGYRQYPPDAVHRVRMVRGALAVGFRLDELARVLRVRDRGGAPCRQVYELAAGKLVEFDRRIAELTALRGRLQSIVDRWETRLSRTPEGRRAGLLEILIQPPSGEDESDET
ncbi:MAG TPA: heavy metal-responsive transcriptional regulator [Verrucomicrobiae bacterium]|nr:heavy metal-responsive transcriptional regulator [Verrucomicrobiae bacterium]